MRFYLPHQSIEFEIPDQWWDSAQLGEWTPRSCSYTATSTPEFPTKIVSISEIEPPKRKANVEWFQHQRMISVLRGFRDGNSLPPIEVFESPADTLYSMYQVRDGFHRYYASVAVGFTHLPVSVRPYFDFRYQ